MTTSKEERAYRSSSKKCIKGEARSRLLEDLVKKKIGLHDVEEFVSRERKTFQGGGPESKISKIKQYEEERLIVVKIMRRKLRENIKHCMKLRREKLPGAFVDAVG